MAHLGCGREVGIRTKPDTHEHLSEAFSQIPLFVDSPAESVLSSRALIPNQITVYQVSPPSDSSLNVHIASGSAVENEVGVRGKVMLISVVIFGARYNRNQGHFSPNDLCNLIPCIPCIPAKEINTGV